MSLGSLTKHQYELIKGHIVNIDNRFNEVFPSFDPLNPEFLSNHRIIDSFSSCFFFHLSSNCNDQNLKSYIQQLDNLAFESSSIPSNALIITDASIKNNVAMSILHIHIHNKPVTKTLYHTVNIMSTEAKLFTIRCSINQATIYNDISKIIVITDSIHAVKKIFDPSTHPFQKHPAAILNKLQVFFSQHQENSIKFWECSSQCNWSSHKAVDIETKLFNLIPLFSSKLSWDLSKKNECNNLLNRWKMTFQALDLKGKHFLDLVDSNDNIIELFYIKGGLWLKYFGYSNLLCTRALRAITNHAPTGKYRLRFFFKEDFCCPCGQYPIETR